MLHNGSVAHTGGHTPSSYPHVIVERKPNRKEVALGHTLCQSWSRTNWVYFLMSETKVFRQLNKYVNAD